MLREEKCAFEQCSDSFPGLMGQGQVSISPSSTFFVVSAASSPPLVLHHSSRVWSPQKIRVFSPAGFCWNEVQLVLEWRANPRDEPRERDVWITEAQEGVVGELHTVFHVGSTFNHSGRTITDSCPTQQTARKFMEREDTRALQLKERRITQSELNWWIDLLSNSLNWMLDSLIYWHYSMW